MKHIKLFEKFSQIDEMAQITKKGKTVYADGKPLRDATIQELEPNMGLVHFKESNWFYGAGKFFLYLASDPAWNAGFKTGESDMLIFPIRTNHNMFTVSPITDVWKKSWTKKYKNSDLVIGMVEGTVGKDKLFVEMMSVRPGYKMNSINTKLIDTLVDWHPDLQLTWVDPTNDGLEFIHKYSGDDAHFHWTGTYRPKKMKEYYPNPNETVATKE
jgi:hypothetical protein